MMKFLTYILFCFALLLNFNSIANAGSLYAGVDAMATRVDVDGTDFSLVMPKVRVGFIVVPQVAVELQFAGDDEEDDNNSILKISDMQAAYLKLSSKPDADLRLSILLGAAESTVKVTGQNSISDTYSGFSASMVFEHVMWSEDDLFSFEVSSFYKNDGVKISTLSMGYVHVF